MQTNNEDRKAIYLAGKISKNDWRHEIVKGLREALVSADWPRLQRAIDGKFDYVGPFFMTCDHGCYHIAGSHGFGPDARDDGCITMDGDKAPVLDTSGHGIYLDRPALAAKCLGAVEKADLFFAWIGSDDCHGTLVELGYALGLYRQRGRPSIAVAFASDPAIPWFGWAAVRGSDTYVVQDDNPSDALRKAIDNLGWNLPAFESPLEEAFWQTWQVCCPDLPLEIQHSVQGGRYRLDFAHLASKVAIECDGITYHGDELAFQRDRQRDRELMQAGWRTVRFAGSEIRTDVETCVRSAAELIRGS